jgi:chromate reductase
MKIVALNGSLRNPTTPSANAALMRAAARVAPAGVEVVLYGGLGELPPFNPDLDTEGSVPPPAVAELRQLILGADAVLISSPEYAHGVPGALKNLLDWLVSVGELSGKRVALVNAARAGGQYAQAALLEILRAMNWHLVPEATLTEPFVTEKIVGELTEEAALEKLRKALAALVG